MTTSVDFITGQIDYTDYGKDGTTRMVGIYIDPIVTYGEVIQGMTLILREDSRII